MLLKAVLVHEKEVVLLAILLGGGGIGAPLFQPRHFLWKIKFLAAFGLDNPDNAVSGADDETSLRTFATSGGNNFS